MPTVNISEENMEMIEEIRQESKWEPSNREIADRAIENLHEDEVVQSEQTSEEVTQD